MGQNRKQYERTEPKRSDFGKLLHKEFLNPNGLTQKQLAEESRISPQLSSRIKILSDMVTGTRFANDPTIYDQLYAIFVALKAMLEAKKVAIPADQAEKLLKTVKNLNNDRRGELLARLIDEGIVKREYTTLQGFPLLGRNKDIRDIIKLLVKENVRFLTIIGVPGVGKSELAWQVMEQEQIRREFLTLEPVTFAGDSGKSTDEIKGKVTHALTGTDKQEKILINLNDCEEIAGNEEAMDYLRGLFITYPNLTILATSRALLPSSEKYPYDEDSLASLAVPQETTDEPEQLEQYDAIRLFCEGARRVTKRRFHLTDQNASEVANICTGLGGLPLAMIIAGSLVSQKNPKKLYKMLVDRSIQEAETALPQPQKRLFSLNALISVSYSLLDTKKQALFRRLGIFRGQCNTEAIAAICSLDNDVPTDPNVASFTNLLNTLAIHHLISYKENWVQIAHVTLRDYALQKLEENSDEAERVKQQFAACYCQLADEFWSPSFRDTWIRRAEFLDHEKENFHQTYKVVYELNVRYIKKEIARLLGEECEPVLALMAEIKQLLGHDFIAVYDLDYELYSVDDIIDLLNDKGKDLTNEGERELFLYLAANEEAVRQAQFPFSEANLSNFLTLYTQYPGDPHYMPDEINGLDIREWKAHLVSAYEEMVLHPILHLRTERQKRKEQQQEEEQQQKALYDLYDQAWLYLDHGEYEQAEPLLKRVLANFEQSLGTEHPDTATCLNSLGILYYRQGKYAEAEPLYQRALMISEKTLGIGDPNTVTTLNNLVKLYRAQGKDGEAESLLQRPLTSDAFYEAYEKGYWKCDSCGRTKKYLTEEEVEKVKKVFYDPKNDDYSECVPCPFCIKGKMVPPKDIPSSISVSNIHNNPTKRVFRPKVIKIPDR